MMRGDRVCTPSGRTGTVVSIAENGEFAFVLRDDLRWPVPYDFYELGPQLDQAA
jgi:hypothetical protein